MNRRRYDPTPLLSHAEARAVGCPRCGAGPGDPCVTVGVPVTGRPMQLHHAARYAAARAMRRKDTR